MAADLAILKARLGSTNKEVRLKALKLILTHPEATSLQLARSLCSPDNLNFEFLEVFELGRAMRKSWNRLAGTEDVEVYRYLLEVSSNDKSKVHIVAHILKCIKTPRALEMRRELKRKYGPM